jgi:hypothetical protein
MNVNARLLFDVVDDAYDKINALYGTEYEE